MINIVFFSKYREQMGMPSLSFNSGSITRVSELMLSLRQRYPANTLFLADPGLLIAVNQEIATAQSLLKPGDEVAFFPPVTGG